MVQCMRRFDLERSFSELRMIYGQDKERQYLQRISEYNSSGIRTIRTIRTIRMPRKARKARKAIGAIGAIGSDVLFTMC